MTQQATDSIQQQGTATAEEAVAVRHLGQPTPAEVLSWLPKTATPAQQDSAIRAHIKIKPATYSSRPDTLGTPQTKPCTETFNIKVPQWHGKSLVQKDSIYKPEVIPWRQGIGGDPVPYTLATDNVVTAMLLGCFIIALVAIAQSKNFLFRQAKRFFYTPRQNTTEMSETSSELRFQLFLMMQTCLLFALTFFYTIGEYASQTFVIDQYLVIGYIASVFACYFIAKGLIYWLVGWLFFNKKKTLQWLKAYIFLISAEGLLLYPLVMLMTYFNMDGKNAVVYMGIVVIMSKLMGFYKTFIIFFKSKGSFLQNILYFCALEIVPAASLWGILITACNYLKVNF